ncbi:DNA-3-methyladenine glycosylase I [Albidovulum inexpectatum]|uniref:DNA-3-methyladenine glycosylase I n=1 Tax=Albidovulum inexpectatum TaxID=196587 RepID=A0A2S5JGK9_9RHOB|nr:DNA-3-methyladenine glycosylase I [Albidovulum inexpectatum]PPB80531.1 DNA-3-methyladenine glycosylase I [Albidovulum inexpectatum]
MTERCPWCGTDPIYVAYHDHEWGVPERDPRALWEKLILDGFQAGLSWITILRKRDNFRTAFRGFDPEVIAGWGEPEIDRLIRDAGIVRSRAKIEATIGNARAYLRLSERQGFDDFLWRFVDGRPIQNRFARIEDVPAQTVLSQRISKELRDAGFRFCGPVITYAFMQAVGMVNDHLVTCPAHDRVASMAHSGA